jgi:hypothetical protein
MAQIRSQAVFTVANIRSPGGRDYGQRFMAALPNDAGRTPRGDHITSYKPPYLLYDGVVTSQADIDRHMANVAALGFDL